MRQKVWSERDVGNVDTGSEPGDRLQALLDQIGGGEGNGGCSIGSPPWFLAQAGASVIGGGGEGTDV